MNQKPNSNKPNALASLRKVIREEVKSAIKEEMVPILLEIIKASNIKPSTVPATKLAQVQTNTSTAKMSNPMLEQTRMEMLAQMGLGDATSFRNMINPTTPFLSEDPVNTVQSSYIPAPAALEEQVQDPMYQVNRMLMSANKSSKEEMVEINEVPDFSAIMKKMNM